MNKIFKTKYDITTGQCKAVSELASNRQIASSSESKPKCGVFFGVFGAFKLAPLVLALSVALPVEVLGQNFSPGVLGLQEGEAKDVENMMKTGISGEGFIEVDTGSFSCRKQSNGAGGGFGASNNQGIRNCSSSPIKIKLKDDITQKITKATELSDLFSRGGTETAPDGTTFHVFDGNISVNWKNAGTGASKQVIEVGKQGSESLLKHVAAGKVEDGSTYAVNGGQLYSVIEFFGEFGKKVLGAEVFDDGTQKNYRFGKTTFKGVEYNGSSRPAGKTTFKDAINEAINAINQGMTFKVGGSGSGNNNIKRQLGQSLTFKGDDYLTLSTESSGSNNSKDQIKFEVKVATSITDTGTSGGNSNGNGDDKKLVTVSAVKTYVDSKLKSGGGSGGSSTGTQSLHYLSVNDGTNGAGSGSGGSSSGNPKGNYNNDGAKMEGAIAIGVGAEATEKYSIALGYEAKSKAEQAIVIGKDLNVDVKHSVLLGSGITVTQGSKEKQDAVVAVGNGVTFSNAKGSIAISAVNEGNGSDHTKLDNAEWSLALGNKNKINSGTDIVALGNNITVNKNGNGGDTVNNSLVIIGNHATAQNAQNSVVIGKSATSKASGAVAIGESAFVSTAAGDSIALGRNSKATATKTAISSADLNVGTESLTFSWTGGGAGMNKSVVSVGDVGNERIITNVAAGTLTEGSTDAVNAAQLVSVIDVFGKLGTDILGAEVDKSSKTFKNSSFAKLKDASGNETSSNAPSTFKDAIDKNIAKINEGLKFKVENGTSAGGSAGTSSEMTRQLGATVTFKTGQHLKASLDSSKGEISFNVEATDSIADGTASGGSNGGGSSNAGIQSNKLVTEMAVRNYLTEKLKNVGGTLKLKGDNTKNTDYGKVELNKAQLEIKGDGDIVTSVTKDSPTVTIKLADQVKKKLEVITVNGNGDNSFALGKNSTWEGKTTAATSADINVGSASLKFDWNNAGAGADKEVVSVGSSGAERIIKHVAAGSVMPNSTDAINGGQLYSVIETFGKLGTDILGAEVDKSSKTFKNSSFAKLKDASGNETSSNAPSTFKDAIDKNIAKLNEGLKFKGDKSDGNNGEAKQLYLGSTLTIKGAETTAQTPAQGADAAKHQNITTMAKDGGILEIALNEELKGITSIGKDKNNVLTFKNGSSGGNSVELKVGGASLTFTPTGNGDNKVKISGIADGSDGNDVVNVNQLNASKLHYLSVKGNGTSNGDNYNNDGAKGDKSIAIGVGASTGENGQGIGAVALGSGAEVKSEYGVAIGHGTVVGTGAKNSIAISATKDNDKGSLQNAEWAISIGNKNNVSGGNDIVALGSNITISKTENKDNHSVIAIGNTVTLQNAKQSIGVGRDTKITNAEWAVAIGNKNSITGGNDIVALGSNIMVTGTNNANDSVLVFGNGAKASSAKNSVVIGREAESKAQSAVVLGKGANVAENAAGAVAIGEDATVETAAGDSIALGKGSKAKEKQIAPTGITQTTGQGQVKITWTGAGTSSSDAKDKTVVSVGDKGSERIITNVAAGLVQSGSTDAINGGQLAEVISVFGKLGFDVLGAEKHDTDDGFKQSTFAKVEYKRASQEQAKAPTTFREAINESITAINKGLMFSADQSAVANGTQNTPHYLGSTINIVRLASNTAGATSTPAPAGTSSQPNIAEFKGDNLITRYTNESGNAKIEIGFKNAPMFEKVMLSQKQMYENGKNSKVGENDLITKSYLEEALSSFKFKVENGGGQTVEIGRGDTLKFTSGQNIKVDLAKNGTTPSSTGSTSPSASASAPAPTPAAPAPASSAAPSSSSGGAGSNGGGSNSMASSGGSNGAGMATTTPTSTPTTTTPTTAVVTIGTTEELKNITSISSKPKDGSAGGNGEVTKLTLDPTDGATFQVGTTGSKVKIDKDGISLTPQGANSANSSPVETPSIVIKAGAKPVDKNSLESFEKDQGPSIAFSTKDTDGKKIGSGKITGLADIKEGEKDGTIAVNKNYVDKLDKVTVKYDDEHKKSITLGGKDTNGGGTSSHSPVAIKNLKSALGLDDNGQQGQQTEEKSLELVKKLVSGGMSSQQGQQMTKEDLHKAANLADLKAVAQAGLSFAGNESGKDKTVHRKLSDTLIIKGEENATTGSSATDKFNSTTTAAGNIKVEANTAKDGLEIKLSDTLKNMKAFETKEESGKKSTLNSDGLTVVNKNGSNNDKSATYGADNIMLEDKKTGNKATITAESLTFADNVAQNQQNPKMPKAVLNKNGLTVTGANGEIKIDGENGIITVPDIKPTTSESAVVNKKYVDTLQRQTDQKLSNLNNKLDMSNKELRAGIAGALATSGLPMSSVPGKSMFAASAGSYKGQSAVALGYSRVSDNGKITLRLQGTRSSTGDVGGSVGVGYQW
ncbi:YadA-like family protein [Histophilus somni]|uniref:YadA-like family protein n=1 Tax=Histophilus somni TaxID=731 RepID=UPI003877920D